MRAVYALLTLINTGAHTFTKRTHLLANGCTGCGFTAGFFKRRFLASFQKWLAANTLVNHDALTVADGFDGFINQGFCRLLF